MPKPTQDQYPIRSDSNDSNLSGLLLEQSLLSTLEEDGHDVFPAGITRASLRGVGAEVPSSSAEKPKGDNLKDSLRSVCGKSDGKTA
jgi:hypothetical protein